MSEWPPRDRRQQTHHRQSSFKQPYQPHRRAARPPGPPPLPDLTQPILIVLALAFLVATLAFFGPPIEVELAYRRLSRFLRKMGLLSWWNGPPSAGGGKGELTGKQPLPRRRRGGDLNKTAATISPASDSSLDGSGYFPGLVNSSGAFCFLNSVLQAMAALPPFLTYLAHLHSQALTYDVPSPLLDVLIPLLSALSTPSTSYSRPLRLTTLIEAIMLAPIFKTSGMFNRMREQQDAQELWQLLMSAVEEEADAIRKIGVKEGTEGFRGLITPNSNESIDKPDVDSPFKGRLAYRRGCRICGYSEGIRLTAFDNLQLPVPRTLSTPLSSLLETYTSLDILTDAQCRRCRITQTLKTLERNLPLPPPPEETSAEPISSSKKKRLREARKELERETELVDRVRTLAQEGRWEDDIEGITWELVDGGISTRQDMFSLPPPILALHLNRSSYTSHYASKNPCRILFPSLLDLTPFCTTGTLSLSPSSSISTPPPPPPSVTSFLSSASPFMVVGPNGTTKAETPPPPAPALSSKLPPQTYYRLSSAIFHLGNHYAGHYITYRRVKKTERWLRVSDEDVDEVRGGVDEVKSGRGDAFMLFYERMDGEELASASNSKGVEPGRVLRSVRLAMGDSSEGSGSTVASGVSAPSTSAPSSPLTSADATLPVLTGFGGGTDAPAPEPEVVDGEVEGEVEGDVGRAVEPEQEEKPKKRKNKKKKTLTKAGNEGAG